MYIHIHTYTYVNSSREFAPRSGVVLGKFLGHVDSSHALSCDAARCCGAFASSPTVDFRNFIVFLLGRDPGTLKSDIVSKQTSTMNLFGLETLTLKIRRLKLWKPTVHWLLAILSCQLPFRRSICFKAESV